MKKQDLEALWSLETTSSRSSREPEVFWEKNEELKWTEKWKVAVNIVVKARFSWSEA